MFELKWPVRGFNKLISGIKFRKLLDFFTHLTRMMPNPIYTISNIILE